MVFVFDEWSWIKRLSAPSVQQRHLGSCTEKMSRWAKTLGNLKCAQHTIMQSFQSWMTQQTERGGERGFLSIPKQLWLDPGFPSICSRVVEKPDLGKQWMCCLFINSPKGRGRKTKNMHTSFFFNIPKLTLTTTRGQVNACEPDYPVHPAPPWGFQHFLS